MTTIPANTKETNNQKTHSVYTKKPTKEIKRKKEDCRQKEMRVATWNIQIMLSSNQEKRKRQYKGNEEIQNRTTRTTRMDGKEKGRLKTKTHMLLRRKRTNQPKQTSTRNQKKSAIQFPVIMFHMDVSGKKRRKPN